MDIVKPKGKCGAEASAPAEPQRLDLDEVRERLRQNRGPEFWRSLDQLAATPEFQEMLHREFPRHASEWPETDGGVSRRGFLQLASASLAFAGLTACTSQPLEKIVPYVRQPEQLVPGKPLWFATAVTHCGYAMGVLAESHQGRPTKLEGNPDHPASLGATDVFTQAAVLTLYDPERSQTVLHAGRPSSWGSFLGEAAGAFRALGARGGEGLRLLTGTVTSPTQAAQVQDLLRRFPRARWHRWEPAAAHNGHAAAVRAFGRPLDTRYDFRAAKVVLTLNADPFAEGPGSVRYSRDFADGRRVRKDNPTMNRLYAVESFPTCTGSIADNRLQLPAGQVEAFALALAEAVGVAAGGAQALSDERARAWVQTVSADLRQNQGASLVVADDHASPALQVLVHAINQALGNAGRTVFYTEPVAADPVDHVQSLAELVRDMNAGRVELLLMLDGVNPVYTAPADLPFAQALQKVRLSIHHGLYEDETSAYCTWHVNGAHELESWGDARSFDGTVTVIQPLIEPLYNGRTATEVLAAFSDRPDATAYDLVRDTWGSRLRAGDPAIAALLRTTDPGGVTTAAGFGTLPSAMSKLVPDTPGAPLSKAAQPVGGNIAGATAGTVNGPGAAAPQPMPGTRPTDVPVGANGTAATQPSVPATTGGAAGGATGAPATTGAAGFDVAWRRVLHAGLIPNTQAPVAAAAPAGGAVQQAASEVMAAVARAGQSQGGITLLLRPDPTVWDGRYATNVWLQELPKPITKLTWDNALLLSPKTGQRLKVDMEETVEISANGRKVKAAVFYLPGMAEDTGVLSLGYGRRRSGKAEGLGFEAYPLRTTAALTAMPAAVRGLGDRYPLASTQNHHLLDPGWEEMQLAGEEAEKREIIRTGTLAEFQQNPNFIQEERESELPAPDETMYKWKYDGHAWAMSIDLNVCTGCSSCVIACQSENNIPVVGKEQVLKHRMMHWLRVDRYFAGPIDDPVVHHQPVPCMQCENAPCEVVCPVAATVHSDEGLNDMVYNRCVGTRYCSNNCPYKVRRFNFLRYSDRTTPVLALLQNPDVTVRMRGVMEKCTYCVQRIEEAKIESKVEGRPIPPNWLKTACQQACPTGAIVFGDKNDAAWEVTRLKAEPLNYGMLEELNTRPRTTYLAKLRNPNPALESTAPAKGAEHGHA